MNCHNVKIIKSTNYMNMWKGCTLDIVWKLHTSFKFILYQLRFYKHSSAKWPPCNIDLQEHVFQQRLSRPFFFYQQPSRGDVGFFLTLFCQAAKLLLLANFGYNDRTGYYFLLPKSELVWYKYCTVQLYKLVCIWGSNKKIPLCSFGGQIPWWVFGIGTNGTTGLCFSEISKRRLCCPAHFCSSQLSVALAYGHVLQTISVYLCSVFTYLLTLILSPPTGKNYLYYMEFTEKNSVIPCITLNLILTAEFLSREENILSILNILAWEYRQLGDVGGSHYSVYHKGQNETH